MKSGSWKQWLTPMERHSSEWERSVTFLVCKCHCRCQKLCCGKTWCREGFPRTTGSPLFRGGNCGEMRFMGKILQYPIARNIYHNSHSLGFLRSCRIYIINGISGSDSACPDYPVFEAAAGSSILGSEPIG